MITAKEANQKAKSTDRYKETEFNNICREIDADIEKNANEGYFATRKEIPLEVFDRVVEFLKLLNYNLRIADNEIEIRWDNLKEA